MNECAKRPAGQVITHAAISRKYLYEDNRRSAVVSAVYQRSDGNIITIITEDRLACDARHAAR
jgi:hypothetical protein